jgi:hypothetical protein
VITLQDGALKSDVLVREPPQAGRHTADLHSEPSTDRIVALHNRDLPDLGPPRGGRHAAHRL